jgi:hypothetical protein
VAVVVSGDVVQAVAVVVSGDVVFETEHALARVREFVVNHQGIPDNVRVAARTEKWLVVVVVDSHVMDSELFRGLKF